MVPAAAIMSSVHPERDGDKCVNGNTNDACVTAKEQVPWLAVNFGAENVVSIGRVELLNRHESCCYKRTKNIEVRLANELPESTKEMFTGGELLGTFKGPASKNQSVEIYSAQGWEQKKGHFLIIQMNMGAGKDHLNLKEVVAYGVAHSYRTGTMCLMSKNCRRQSF